jgi:HPt (histidine-containing phosphotransfer) domain-containing protein
MSLDLSETRWAQLRRLGGDKLIVELIDLFLQLAPQRLEAARTGLAAGDLAAVARAAHSLTSSAGNLGVVRVQEAAAALERQAMCGAAAEVPGLMEQLETAWIDARNLLQQKRQEIQK